MPDLVIRKPSTGPGYEVVEMHPVLIARCMSLADAEALVEARRARGPVPPAVIAAAVEIMERIAAAEAHTARSEAPYSPSKPSEAIAMPSEAEGPVRPAHSNSGREVTP